MNNDPRAGQFVGGTVYQAFLSADSYHRWHAPVSGKIVSTSIVPGTYYSEPLCTGFSPDSGHPDPDPGADEASQGYISAVATRGVIFIQANNPDIGLVCLIMVGMAEVSSVVRETSPYIEDAKKSGVGGMKKMEGKWTGITIERSG
jgi:phosphatidylserine decarboxylase